MECLSTFGRDVIVQVVDLRETRWRRILGYAGNAERVNHTFTEAGSVSRLVYDTHYSTQFAGCCSLFAFRCGTLLVWCVLVRLERSRGRDAETLTAALATLVRVRWTCTVRYVCFSTNDHLNLRKNKYLVYSMHGKSCRDAQFLLIHDLFPGAAA